MDDLASQIALKVVEDTKYFTAIIGLIGDVNGVRPERLQDENMMLSLSHGT